MAVALKPWSLICFAKENTWFIGRPVAVDNMSSSLLSCFSSGGLAVTSVSPAMFGLIAGSTPTPEFKSTVSSSGRVPVVTTSPAMFVFNPSPVPASKLAGVSPAPLACCPVTTTSFAPPAAPVEAGSAPVVEAAASAPCPYLLRSIIFPVTGLTLSPFAAYPESGSSPGKYPGSPGYNLPKG